MRNKGSGQNRLKVHSGFPLCRCSVTEACVKVGRGLASTKRQNWRSVYWLTTVSKAEAGLTGGTEEGGERGWDHPGSCSLPVSEKSLTTAGEGQGRVSKLGHCCWTLGRLLSSSFPVLAHPIPTGPVHQDPRSEASAKSRHL